MFNVLKNNWNRIGRQSKLPRQYCTISLCPRLIDCMQNKFCFIYRLLTKCEIKMAVDIYRLLTKCEIKMAVDIGQVLFCLFMDRDGVSFVSNFLEKVCACP